MCRACIDDRSAALICEDRLPSYLRQIYLFHDLTDEQIAQVLAGSRTEKLKDGRWLFRQGDSAARFFIVREGQVALFRQSADGRETIVALVGPDEVFGEDVLVLPKAEHDLNARAVGDCTLLSLERQRLRRLLLDSVPLSFRLMATLYRRQTMLLDHIERLTLLDATQRVMAYFLAQVGSEESPHRLELSLPKNTLATHLSIQPETLSRILARLKQCDYIREEGEDLIVETAAMRSGLSCSLCEQRWGCPGPSRLSGDGLPQIMSSPKSTLRP